MKYICKDCNKEFDSKHALITHIAIKHKPQFKDFDEKYKFYNYILENKEIPKCEICGINDIYVKSNRGSTICSNKNCRREHFSQIQKEVYQNNPELKENARIRRLKYLSDKSNFNSTAFGNRVNKKLSYLEQWFYDNIIIKYNLTNNYTIINEYTESMYFLDFAFINIKLDVELDGKCHFNNDNKRIDHDIKRDTFLRDKGWNIYRISWYDVKYNEQETIDKFINLLNSNNFIYDKSYYIRHKVLTNKEFKYQQEQRNNKKEQKLLNKQKRINYFKNILIDLEINSKINFSKFGWVNKATKYLQEKNIRITQLHRTIKLYYPEFFENNKVFIRKHN